MKKSGNRGSTAPFHPRTRGEVNRRVRLKFSPSLSFEIDRSFEHVQRIDRLLDAGSHSDE